MPTRMDQWAADQFTVHRPLTQRDPSLLARGITANVTGSRADVVICDDVEVPNTCNTPGKRERCASDWLISYILVPGGLQLYVGAARLYYDLCRDRRESGEARPFLGGFVRLSSRSSTARAEPLAGAVQPRQDREIRRQTGRPSSTVRCCCNKARHRGCSSIRPPCALRLSARVPGGHRQKQGI
jgi:hypothetical protein